MADSTLQIIINARDNASAVLGGVARTAGELGDRTKGILSGIGSSLAGVGKIAGGFVLGQGLLKAPGALLGLTDTSRDLELQLKKANTVFGDQMGVVQAWAAENASAMGLSRSQATNLAAGLADLLVPMGMTREEAAAMSTKTIGLAGALAEWSGGAKSAAEVSDILTKAYLGETDGLKALGISISAADVAQRLAEKGQKDLTGAAREQAEALAIQELVFEKSTDAQKAFAEGAGSTARKQAEMSARIAEAKERIAVALTPAIQALTTLLVTAAVPAFELLGQGIQYASDFVNGFVAAVRDPDVTSGGVFGMGERMGVLFATQVLPVLRDVMTFIRGDLVPAVRQDLIPALIAIGTWIAQNVVPQVIDFAAVMRDVIVATVTEIVIPALITLRQGWADIQPAVAAVASFLAANVLPVLQTVGDFLLEHKEIIIAAAAAILLLTNPWLAVAAAVVVVLAKWDDIKEALTVTVPAAIDSVLDKVREIPVIGEIFSGALETARIAVETAFALIQAVVGTHVEAVVNLVQFWIAIFSGDWGRAWTEAKELVTGVLAGIRDVVEITLGAVLELVALNLGTLLGVFTDSVGLIRAAVETAFGELKTFLIGNWQEILSVALTILTGPLGLVVAFATNAFGIRDAVTGAFGELKTNVETLLGELLAGASGLAGDIASGVVGAITGIPGLVLQRLGEFRSAGSSLGAELVEGLKEGVRSVVGFAGGVAGDIGGAVKDWINQNVIDKINRSLEFTIKISNPLGPDPSVTVNPPDIPHLAAGLDLVPADMLAQLHRGEMVASAPLAGALRALGVTNRGGRGYGVRELGLPSSGPGGARSAFATVSAPGAGGDVHLHFHNDGGIMVVDEDGLRRVMPQFHRVYNDWLVASGRTGIATR